MRNCRFDFLLNQFTGVDDIESGYTSSNFSNLSNAINFVCYQLRLKSLKTRGFGY